MLPLALLMIIFTCTSCSCADAPKSARGSNSGTDKTDKWRTVPSTGADPVEAASESTDDAEETAEEKAEIPEEEFTENEKEMRDQLPDSFRIARVGPFVVASDQPEYNFESTKRYTIRDCYDAYYKTLFKKRPNDVMKVYLFDGKLSYEKWTKKLFGSVPDTPYGYYSPSRRALIMNIRTGGGTLVHEMAHALIVYDFPDVPSWFNEGVGSLYEQCYVSDDGELRGKTNWRLPILQKAIRRNGGKSPVSLDDLVASTTDEFYGDNKGVSYGLARYFCYYLQQKGLLQKVYKTFRDRYKEDPTGKKFIEEILGEKLSKTQKKLIPYTMKLRFR